MFIIPSHVSESDRHHRHLSIVSTFVTCADVADCALSRYAEPSLAGKYATLMRSEWEVYADCSLAWSVDTGDTPVGLGGPGRPESHAV